MNENKCSSCGGAKYPCKNKDFTKAVIEIDNPEQITLMRKVVIPASMGDDTTVPPVVGKYHNVLLYYEANSKSYLYSSDGIPTQLVNGVTDYEQAVNLPQINGNTLIGDKTATQLGLQDKLTAGDGIEIDGDNTISISDIEQYAHFFDTVADMKAATNLVAGDYAKTLGYYSKNDGGGALYKITSTEPSTYYELLNSSSYAELVDTGDIVPEMFGAYGDGTHDDTTAIQSAIDFTDLLHCDQTYLISQVAIHSNFRMYGKGTFIGSTQGRMIDAIGLIAEPLVNIEFDGLTFKHSDVTFTQQARIIEIRYAKNVVIKNCLFTHWTGDAICISNFQSNEYITRDIYIYDNRFINESTGRQGITILTGSYIYIKDNYFYHTSYSQMPGAIDIEPWIDATYGDLITYEITNIVVDGNYCCNEIYDTAFLNIAVEKAQTIKNITVTNNTVENTSNASGIKIQTGASGSLSGTKNVYIANNNITGPFTNLLVSAFDAVIENNNLTNGVISFGGAYVTNKVPVTNIRFVGNTYSDNTNSHNTEHYVISINLNTDSILDISNNDIEFGNTSSTSWWQSCLSNALLSGNSNPTVKPIYANNQFVYRGAKTTVAFANNSYGVYSNNNIIDGTGAVTTLSIIFNSLDITTVSSNITPISYTDKFTPESTSLETVRSITIPAGCVFSISVYASINNTNISQLEIDYGGSKVADSGPSSSRGYQSVSFTGINDTSSSKTLVIKAAFASANWNNVFTTGYMLKPTYASDI